MSALLFCIRCSERGEGGLTRADAAEGLAYLFTISCYYNSYCLLLLDVCLYSIVIMFIIFATLVVYDVLIFATIVLMINTIPLLLLLLLL